MTTHTWGDTIYFKSTSDYEVKEWHQALTNYGYYKDGDTEVYTVVSPDVDGEYGSAEITSSYNYVKIGDKYYYAQVDGINKTPHSYINEVNPINHDINVNKLKNSFINYLRYVKLASQTNKEISQEILGDDYNVTYSYSDKTLDNIRIEKITVSSRFVMNVPYNNSNTAISGPTNIEDAWFAEGETCVLKLTMSFEKHDGLFYRIKGKIGTTKSRRKAKENWR